MKIKEPCSSLGNVFVFTKTPTVNRNLSSLVSFAYIYNFGLNSIFISVLSSTYQQFLIHKLQIHYPIVALHVCIKFDVLQFDLLPFIQPY